MEMVIVNNGLNRRKKEGYMSINSLLKILKISKQQENFLQIIRLLMKNKFMPNMKT